MSNEEIQKSEKSFVPYEQSLEVAKQLLEEYKDELAKAGGSPKTFDEGVSPYTHDATSHFLKDVPPEIQEEFWGHGISKKSEVDILAALINILENHSIRGDTGRLIDAGTGKTYIPAYKKSPFLIVSHFKRPLVVTKDNRAVFNEIGAEVDAGAIIVNNDYYPLVEKLKALYPGANIIKANELPEYIKKESGMSD